MEVKEYLEKAKNRLIHEFEYKDGKYIQHYVLGGEHEMQPQEIIDCLNALATMDCDLQTAYAYIKGQDKKNRELKEQLDKAEQENIILKKALKEAEEVVRKTLDYYLHRMSFDDIQKDDLQYNYWSKKAKKCEDVIRVIQQAKERL